MERNKRETEDKQDGRDRQDSEIGQKPMSNYDGRNEQQWFIPRSGRLFNPFYELEYIGGKDSKNPVRFIDDFERIAEYETVPEHDKLYFLGNCMRQKASDWWSLQKFRTYSETEKKFLKHYWGDESQEYFRQEIYLGKYTDNERETMSE